MSLKSRYLLRACLSVHLISSSLIILKFSLKQQIGFYQKQEAVLFTLEACSQARRLVRTDGWSAQEGRCWEGRRWERKRGCFLGQPARVNVVSWHRQCLGMTGHLQLEYRTVKLDAEVDCLVVDAKVFVIQKVEIFLNDVAKSCVHMFQVVHIFKATLQQFENLYEHQIREKIKLHIRNLQHSEARVRISWAQGWIGYWLSRNIFTVN